METLLTGVVLSGGPTNPQTIPDATVTVFEAMSDQPLVVGSATTNGEGRFEIRMDRNTSDRIFYATARVHEGVELVTIIGPSFDPNFPAWITASEVHPGNTASIVINELTTVAAAFSMAQFAGNGVIGGDAFGLRLASLMNDNLVSIPSGSPSEVLLHAPNADQTNSLRSTRSLANLIAACVQEIPEALGKLFALTTPPYNGQPPTNTFQALLNIAHYPDNNVAGIYTQSQVVDTYSPALESMPDAWTLAVKVNNTGSLDHLWGGPGNVAFDDRGYAWITNNVVQGTPNSCHFAVVLKPNGKPADGSPTTPLENPDGLPRSPLHGGGLLGGGFGVVVSKAEHTKGYVWFGNYGWGTQEYWPKYGSVSLFNPAGKSVSPDTGYVEGIHRVQGMAIDDDDNLWMASYENGLVVVYLKGDPHNRIAGPVEDGFLPFDVAIAPDGSAWVTSGAGLYEYKEGNLSHFRIVEKDGKHILARESSEPFGRGLKGLSIDSAGNLWIAAGGIDAVCLIDTTGTLTTIRGGGINGPWGTTIDGDGNVWVSNFGQMLPNANYTTAAISKIAGANPNARPPWSNLGDPISPKSGYTLPSANAPVTMANGAPLYGDDGPESFSPMMRLTNCSIDQAGNIWACNNWKPDFATDHSPTTGNPGGDGIVIFVGLAKPPVK